VGNAANEKGKIMITITPKLIDGFFEKFPLEISLSKNNFS